MKNLITVIVFLSALFRVSGEPLNSRVDLGTSTVIQLELPGVPLRVAGEIRSGIPLWFVRLDDGRFLEIDPGSDTGFREINSKDAGLIFQADHQPPPYDTSGRDFRIIQYGDYSFRLDVSGDFQLSGPGGRVLERGNSLPDAFPAYDGEYLVILSDASNDYRHGILGNKIEPSGFTVYRTSVNLQSIGEYQLPVGSVFETLRPTLADIDGDDVPEVLLTVSNSRVGAAIYAYRLDGTPFAESAPIGLGNRWTHLLGAAATGPRGETEIITVRTPHIGGSLEYYRLQGNRLELVHRVSGFSTHSIGSRNLDMAAIGDFDGGRRPDVLLPSQDFKSLSVIERTPEGSREIWKIELESRLTSNIALLEYEGGSQAAWGTEEGVFQIRSNNP